MRFLLCSGQCLVQGQTFAYWHSACRYREHFVKGHVDICNVTYGPYLKVGLLKIYCILNPTCSCVGRARPDDLIDLIGVWSICSQPCRSELGCITRRRDLWTSSFSVLAWNTLEVALETLTGLLVGRVVGHGWRE